MTSGTDLADSVSGGLLGSARGAVGVQGAQPLAVSADTHEAPPEVDMPRMVEHFYNNLAAAVLTNKPVQAELVEANLTLTSTHATLTGANSELVATVKCLTSKTEEL